MLNYLAVSDLLSFLCMYTIAQISPLFLILLLQMSQRIVRMSRHILAVFNNDLPLTALVSRCSIVIVKAFYEAGADT